MSPRSLAVEPSLAGPASVRIATGLSRAAASRTRIRTFRRPDRGQQDRGHGWAAALLPRCTANQWTVKEVVRFTVHQAELVSARSAASS